MKRRGLVVLLVPFVLAPGIGGACAACGDRVASSDAGDAGYESNAPDGMADVLDDPKPCTPKPRPSSVPANWVPWDRFIPCSGMYVPTSAQDLPTPLVWEDCGPNVSPSVPGCQRIVNPPNATAVLADVAVTGGSSQLMFNPLFRDHSLVLGADLDGNVHTAMISTWEDKGTFGDGYSAALSIVSSMSSSFWITTVWNTAWGGHTEGYVAGRTTEVAPEVAGRYFDGDSHAFIIGEPGIFHMGPGVRELLTYSTGQPNATITNPAQSSGVGSSFPHFERNDLFMFGNAGRLALQRRWRVDGGTEDFIGYYDPDHGAGDLGTDGVDMVWLESHGPATQNAFWTSADYWTSPYVTEKKDLKPRRLRSEIPNVLAGDVIKVGCGLAALVSAIGLRVVRLSDGWSWFLPTDGKGWKWTTALGVTCSHIYVLSGYKAASYLTRLPVGALGPSDPPD